MAATATAAKAAMAAMLQPQWSLASHCFSFAFDSSMRCDATAQQCNNATMLLSETIVPMMNHTSANFGNRVSSSDGSVGNTTDSSDSSPNRSPPILDGVDHGIDWITAMCLAANDSCSDDEHIQHLGCFLNESIDEDGEDEEEEEEEEEDARCNANDHVNGNANDDANDDANDEDDNANDDDASDDTECINGDGDGDEEDARCNANDHINGNANDEDDNANDEDDNANDDNASDDTIVIDRKAEVGV